MSDQETALVVIAAVGSLIAAGIGAYGSVLSGKLRHTMTVNGGRNSPETMMDKIHRIDKRVEVIQNDTCHFQQWQKEHQTETKEALRRIRSLEDRQEALELAEAVQQGQGPGQPPYGASDRRKGQ